MDFSAQVILLVVFGGVTIVMALETLWPLRVVSGTPLWRWLNNMALTATDIAVMLGIGPWLSLLLMQLVGSERSGLLGIIQAGSWVTFLMLLLSLQLTEYWLHRAMHAIPVLWRIHAVHHCDLEVDATTAFRHHPLEIIFSALITLPVVALLMPDPLMLLGYNVLHSVVAVINHGNITFGPRLDRVLRLLVVTPDFHRLHHSAGQHYTDSNYSTILPLFDYVFKTLTYLPTLQQKTMQLGLPYFRGKEYSRLDKLLLIPFLRDFGKSHLRNMSNPGDPKRE